jgi:nucleotide-binding universal stress UspA family protein
MIPLIKRILYTTDLSDNSNQVFKYAINFARKHDAGITILHVMEPLSPTVNAITKAYLVEGQANKISEKRSAYVKDRINKILKFCEKKFEIFRNIIICLISFQPQPILTC